jgi:phage gp36-like protein
MNFLTIADFDIVINRSLLYEVISYPELVNPNSPTPEEQTEINLAESKLSMAADAAISELSGYLANRYDTSAIFAASGISRNAIIVHKCLDIAVYYLYHINSPEAMTELREKAYDKAIDWCEKVNNSQINLPNLPPLQGEENNKILFGSNTKRNHHF